jgi:hypothetical protein
MGSPKNRPEHRHRQAREEDRSPRSARARSGYSSRSISGARGLFGASDSTVAAACRRASAEQVGIATNLVDTTDVISFL